MTNEDPGIEQSIHRDARSLRRILDGAHGWVLGFDRIRNRVIRVRGGGVVRAPRAASPTGSRPRAAWTSPAR